MKIVIESNNQMTIQKEITQLVICNSFHCFFCSIHLLLTWIPVVFYTMVVFETNLFEEKKKITTTKQNIRHSQFHMDISRRFYLQMNKLC